MNLEVKFTDLFNIGHTAFNENGKLAILCDVQVANITKILLRSILSIKGYNIVSVDDFVWENGAIDVQITTDMDWKEYEELEYE
jgi:hypothetical protein